MVHPSPYDAAAMPCLAVQHLRVTYHGKSAHAAAFPHMGRNAADALTVAQVGIGLLRQHIHDSDRIHGIVTDGGDAPNIVPERASGHWYVRAETLAQLENLYPRVRQCFDAGALATGTTVEYHEPGPAYSEFNSHPALEGRWVHHAATLGRHLSPDTQPLSGSTDMANVSLVMPAIHPLIGIDANGAANHQPEFAAACITSSADRALRDGAVTLARTSVDAAINDELRAMLTARPRGYQRSAR